MRKLHLVVAALTVGGALLGQDRRDSVPRGRGALPAMWSKLGLTDEQKQNIYAVQGEYRAKIDALQRQIRQLQRQERGEMEKVLTDAQRARLRELIAEKVSGGASKDGKKTDAGSNPAEKKR